MNKKELLQNEILWSDEEIDNLCNTIDDQNEKKQIVFQGPPGTGKTYVAKALSKYICEDQNNLTIVQFHPSYGYEEFIQGLRPVGNEDGSIEFSVEPGTVLKIHEKAILDPDNKYVLIIDEMNRGNLPKIFGELMYSLEYRNDNDNQFNAMSLQYSEEKINLANNIYFIATMNTADRSIRSIDIALRRRFIFWDLWPDVDILKKFYQRDENNNDLGDDLFNKFTQLNERLTNDIDKHHQIGHSFFMSKDLTKLKVTNTWNRQIKPLLDEYFYDRPDLREDYSNPFN